MRTLRTTITLLTLLQSVFLFSQTADIATGCAPLIVKFTPPAGATSYYWDFKDGATSILQSPSNIFSTPGTYNVEFRASAGTPVLGTITITVYPKPVVGITAVPESGCVPLNVQFTDTTQLAGDIQIQKYSWVFGDAGASAGNAPTHIYSSVGIFTVSLELTTNYGTCNVTQVFPDLIQTGIKPVVGFTTAPAPAIACDPPLDVTLNNTTVGGSGTLSYAWDFGNGVVSDQTNPPVQTYTQTGNYTITLTATDEIGCSATATKQVNIGHPPAGFTAPDTVCVNDVFTLTNSSALGMSYSWDFGPNAIPPTSSQFSPQVAFTAPGLQTVTLTVTSSTGCSSTATKEILADLADAGFTVSPVYSCTDPTIFNLNATSSTTTQWVWTFSDGTTDTTQNPTYTWTTPDTTGYTSLGLFLDTIRLQVTTAIGCVANSIQVDSIWRPNARFIPNLQHGCAPLSVVFADSSSSNEPIVEWTWLFDDDTPVLVNNTNAPVAHTFNFPGEYDVRLVIRNSAGCVDTSYTIRIEVGEPIGGDFTADKFEVCPGDTVQFTNLTNDPRVDGWHFSSESDQLWHCFQEENPTWMYSTQTGPLSVSLTTEYNGCFFTVTKDEFIQVHGPIAQLHYKTTCDNTLDFEFTDESHDATQIMWYLGDGDSTDQMNFKHLYAAPGTYTVVLKAENPASGCPVSYDTATVYPTVLKAMFDLPDTICGGMNQMLDGSKSTSVNATCFKGYTWYFTFNRPIRTDQAVTELLFGPSGPQTVWLEVEDINGCKDTLRDDVVIYNMAPQFTVSDNSICVPSTVSFMDQSTADAQIVKWEWDFGDGGMSTEVNPTHTFATAPPAGQNSFPVKLRIEDDKGCPGETTVNINVYKPVSTITTVPTPPHICSGKEITFIASDFTSQGSNLSWQWDLGNGNTASGKTAKRTFAPEGQYPVKLVFTEIATGCKDSTSVQVDVQDYPQAIFTSTVDNLGIICYPQNVEFNNASVTNFLKTVYWDLGNGDIKQGSPVSTVFPKGTHTVTMVAETTYGCRDTVSRSFTVVGPEGSFTMDKNKICYGDEITVALKDTISISSWTWDFGDGNPVAGGNPVTHMYDPNYKPSTGTTNVKLVLRGEDDACSFTVALPLNFSQVKADFTVQDMSVCLGLPHVFTSTSTSASILDWNFGDGQTDGQTQTSHTYGAEGTYTVKLIATDLPLGCMDSTTQDVFVTGIPNLVAIGNTACPGDTVQINVENMPPNATYFWTPANLVLPPNGEAVVNVVVSQTTDFIVSVTDAAGCMDVDTATVTVPLPYSGAQNLDTIVAKGEKVILPVLSASGYTFEWMPAPGPSGPPYEVIADTSVVYTLIVRDESMCTEREFRFTIRVVSEEIRVPNAFTPNGDDANDDFRLISIGDAEFVQVNSLRIFNRWGQKVFEGSGNLADVGWDGKVDGKEAPTDVYVWVAELEFFTGRKVTMKGDITLLR